MNFKEKWNKNNFSIYNSEEKTVLKLIQNISNYLSNFSIELDNKTDKTGDHLGSWQGINKPTMSEEGLRAAVEKLIEEDLPTIKDRNGYIHIDDIGLTDTKENTTETFLKARTLLEGTNKILQFAPKTYYVSINPYFVNIKGIQGVKGKTKIIIDELEHQQFKIQDSTGFKVSGLTIQSANPISRKFGAGLILTNCSDFDIIDNEISYISAQGILLETCKNGRVKNNYINETTADGIHCHRGCEDIWIEENTIKNVGDDGIGAFTYIDDYDNFKTGKNKNIIIKNNRILSTGNSTLNYGAKGISTGGSENVIISENIVSNCYNGGISVLVDSSATYTVAGVKNVDVKNNKILNTKQTSSLYPITVLTHVDNQNIEDINIEGNTIDNTFKGGIYVGTDNIAKNLISKIKVKDNVIRNSLSTTNNGDAIQVKRVSEIDIIDNKLFNLVGHAINIIENITEKVTVKNNKIVNCNKLKNAVPLFNLRGKEIVCTDNYIVDELNNSTIDIQVNTEGFICENNIVANRDIKYSYSVLPKKLTNDFSSTLFGSAPPTSGTWKKGDKMFFNGSYIGTHVGWICITGGTPGTWEKFGQIGMRSVENLASTIPTFQGEIVRLWTTNDCYIAMNTTAEGWKKIT